MKATALSETHYEPRYMGTDLLNVRTCAACGKTVVTTVDHLYGSHKPARIAKLEARGLKPLPDFDDASQLCEGDCDES